LATNTRHRATINYYPFGSVMNQRTYTAPSTDYKYGFNGKELDKDDEGMGGGGSTYDYGFRIYNPNLGKFLSVDPLTKSYPWYTPYQFAGNKPIWAIDLDGLEEKIVTQTLSKQKDGSYLVTKTDVQIKQDITVTIGDKKYATTDVYYIIDGVTYAGESIYEEITDNGIMPSAQYDYTQNVIEGKGSDDSHFIWFGESDESSTFIGRFGEIVVRDVNAPDNRETIESLEVLDVILPKILPNVPKTGTTSSKTGAKKGSTKNSQHKNQNARDAAKKQYETYNTKYNDLKSKANKTQQDNKDLASYKRKRDHFKKKMDETGENHSQKAKGSN